MRVIDVEYDSKMNPVSIDCEDDGEYYKFVPAAHLEALKQELIDERYLHDRVQDFCVAVCEELRELKEKQHE